MYAATTKDEGNAADGVFQEPVKMTPSTRDSNLGDAFEKPA
ncbi:MAG TPA: hypothetical protein VEK32_03110 [Thermodesulfobacteriota bacterium]|nr:hypothetical protein [Thermodesulfobacteriota bacterium]